MYRYCVVLLCVIVSVARATYTDHVVNFISQHVYNDTCKQHAVQLVQAFTNLELWAVKMIDASAKLQSGLVEGNLKNLGQYDECVETQGHGVQGQYCLVNIKLAPQQETSINTRHILHHATIGRMTREIFANKSEVPILDILPSLSLVQLGVCVPAVCSPEDVERTLGAALNLLVSPAHLHANLHLSPHSCYVKHHEPFTTGQQVLGFVFITLLLLAVAGSIFDYKWPKSQDPSHRVLNCFSLSRNWNNLISTDSKTTSFFTCLDGIRVFNTLWIVYGHKTANYLREPIVNQIKFLQVLSIFWQQPMLNTLMSVDSFFFISGLLKSKQMLREVQNNTFSFVTSAVQRFFRLTPAYAFMILFYSTILPRLGSGPTWNKFVEQPAAACNTNWFLNLLYVHNYINSDNMCMLQSWYLAVDMQLHLLAPLLIYPIWRWAQYAVTILALALTAATVVPYIIIFAIKAPAIFMISASDEQLIDYMSLIYFPTHARASSFIVGVALGYFFFATQNTKFNISKMTVWGGWCLSMVLLYKVLFAAYDLVQFDHKYDATEAAMYGALHRPVWALALAWVVFACQTGHGGWVNSFLSARIFQPLSRLCYCVYLTHFVVLLVESGRMRTPRYIDEYDLVHCLAGDFLVSLLFATVVHLLVEAPITELTNLYYRKGNNTIEVLQKRVEENGKVPVIPVKTKRG